MKLSALIVSVFMLFCSTMRAQDIDMDHHPFPIGEINYFGYGALPLERIRAAIPWHIGDTLTFATYSKEAVDEAVKSAIGKPPTDVNIVCCDSSQRLEIFIGLPGNTSRPLQTDFVPSGQTHLDSRGLRLYQQEQPLLEQAVARGTAAEDDSQGYMLSKDPALRSINIAMRSYAIATGRESELEHVLLTSSEPNDRRAAATLLGYVQRSKAQVNALSKAIQDPDSEVRNNAVRALEVLAAATVSSGQQTPSNLYPFISLLYSGSWTDRNKASLFLMRATSSRNPEMLHQLRSQALEPLVEGGSWTNVPGHSTPFLVILGRIGELSDKKLGDLLKRGDASAIIAAARQSTHP
jgi:hypothetical protein